MRWVYISPHLDDAMLSAGGLMYEQRRGGDRVAIWTVMCAVPDGGAFSGLAERLHKAWGVSSPAEALAMRGRENRAAAAIIGADTMDFEFPDCIYRRGADGPLYESVFVPRHPADAGTPARICEAISAQLAAGDAPVFPLGVGGHIDHVVVRQAAALLGMPVFYYADVPYVLNKRREVGRRSRGLQKKLWRVTENGLAAWLEASHTYGSQIAVEFGSHERMERVISGYWKERGGIDLWSDPGLQFA